MPPPRKRPSTVSPFLVALAAWILPGAGYLLIKQRARGLTIGITVIVLFFMGLLVGGVRCLEVPGYDAHGHATYSYLTDESRDSRLVRHFGVKEKTTSSPTVPDDAADVSWTLVSQPVSEIRNKPWSIAQILIGPIDVACDYWAVSKGRAVDPTNPSSEPIGPRSHSRVSELGILYTAIAAMLNLLAIIDSSHRASHAEAA